MPPVRPKNEGASPTDSPYGAKRRSNRTGQACDRCKVRKIKCNATTEACTPCTMANVPCTNTDLNSRRAVPRGYIENLEAQVEPLKRRVAQLEAAMRHAVPDMNLNQLPEPEPPARAGAVIPSADELDRLPAPYGAEPMRLPVPPVQRIERPPSERDEPWNESLVSILGLQLSLDDLAPRYVGHFNVFAHNRGPVEPKHVENFELPAFEEAQQFVRIYIEHVTPLIPVVEPTWLEAELHRLYFEKGYRPHCLSLMIMNLVFAVSTYIYGLFTIVGEPGSVQNNPSNQSIKYAWQVLPYVSELFTNPCVQSIQCIVLFMLYLRPSPKPDSVWVLGRYGMSLAVQLGMHRLESPELLASLSVQELQRRRLAFWSLHLFEVTVSNRLGRPHAIAASDINVPMPLPVDEPLLTDADRPMFLDANMSHGVVDPRPCMHTPGTCLFGITRISGEAFSSLYSARNLTSIEYEAKVLALEKLLQDWRSRLPEVLTWSPSSSPHELKYKKDAGVLWLSATELHMSIRHPSGLATNNPKFVADSKVLSVMFARELVHTTDTMISLNYLECTWHNIVVILTSVFTIFYGTWAREGGITEADIATVKDDVAAAMRVIDRIARTLDGGNPDNRLLRLVRMLFDNTICRLEEQYSTKVKREQARARDVPESRAGNSISSILNDLPTATYLNSPSVPSFTTTVNRGFVFDHNDFPGGRFAPRQPSVSSPRSFSGSIGSPDVCRPPSHGSHQPDDHGEYHLAAAADFNHSTSWTDGSLKWSEYMSTENRTLQEVTRIIHGHTDDGAGSTPRSDDSDAQRGMAAAILGRV
ncbi:uncharacterized protein V1510DRAFT_404735 [Dipodascopsis tothii]|uniref:uncharacterized protein n=1 Tax=Dipodascopsis tothii TaxID=44089 RepID=UPI0034CD0C9D